jgi:hypothetical protein
MCARAAATKARLASAAAQGMDVSDSDVQLELGQQQARGGARGGGGLWARWFGGTA